MTTSCTKPLLRGWLHQVAFVVAIPALVVLVVVARTTQARIAAIVYGIGVCALYGVSSSYHRFRWSPAVRARMKRADHGTIYVMIAATYTPVCLLVLHGALGTTLLVAAWAGAFTGLLLSIFGVAKRFAFALYLMLGWLAVLALPQIASRLGALDASLLIAGGVVYTIGSLVLATNWPDPFPKVFGYHEVWHTMVVAASVLHYVLIWRIVGP